MTDSQAESAVATFSKPGAERPTTVRIENERKIGSGTFGVISEADVTIGRHTRKFVIKRFNDTTKPAEENAARAMENHEAAKKAGLKVFQTYRLGGDGKSILMTNGNTDSNICVGTDVDSQTVESVFGKKIEQIASEDRETFIDGAFGQAILADTNSIYLHGDAFLFFVDRATQSKVDFIIGDVDGVIPTRGTPGGNLLAKNLNSARAALVDFFLNNVQNPTPYIDEVNDSYSSTVYHHGLTNV